MWTWTHRIGLTSTTEQHLAVVRTLCLAGRESRRQNPVQIDAESPTKVRYQFLILSMVITVVVMNVYIGLLGELYQQAEKRSRQLYNHYRATCAYRHMCERLALCFLPNKLWICCGESSGKTDSGLYWFIYNKKLLTDDEDGESDSKSD